jgi:hypothetical protein
MQYKFAISGFGGRGIITLNSDWETPASILFDGSGNLLARFKDWLENEASGPFGHGLKYSEVSPADLEFALFIFGKEQFSPVLLEGEIREYSSPPAGAVS